MSLPRDTSLWAYQKQHEINQAMSPAERFLLGIQMCEDGLTIMKASILRDQPGLTAPELAAAMFDRMHGRRYSPALRNKIRESILAG